MKVFQLRVCLVLLGSVLVSAVSVVWAHHRSRVLFVELTRLQNARDALNVDFGRLELEQATWAEPGRVERVARDNFGMVDPSPDAIGLIQR